MITLTACQLYYREYTIEENPMINPYNDKGKYYSVFSAKTIQFLNIIYLFILMSSDQTIPMFLKKLYVIPLFFR